VQWTVPAAVAGKDLGAYAADPDGLVCRIMAVVDEEQVNA
jgi:hypothetical protein